MKSTLILKNNGDNPKAEITLQVSYFVKANETIKVEAQEFALTINHNQDEVKEIDFGTSAIEDREVLILIQKPVGNILTQKSALLKNLSRQRQRIEFTINNAIDPNTKPEAVTEKSHSAHIYGRLLDKKGVKKMEDVQVIISAKKDDSSDLLPITVVKTEAQGYFSIEYPIGYFKEANALIGLDLTENPIPIKLEEKLINEIDAQGNETEKKVLVFPNRLILIAELKLITAEEAATKDCGCHANEFEDKRVLEEFSFYSLIRTSQPEIKGYVLEDEDELTLADVLGKLPFSIFELLEPIKALPFVVRESPIKTTTRTARARATANDDDFNESIKSIRINKNVLHNFIRDEKALTKDNISKLFAMNEAHKLQATLNPVKPSKPLGRVELGSANAVDWDDEPTIYQAVSVAHGHVLQFKTEWLADGYSLGDLLYSLPLAPGQKKQIVVFDWERRESASNIQNIDYEESLYNSLSRDRDIFEIAKGTVQENVRGGSRANVSAIAGGIGGFFGVLFGVAGGASNANSEAWQNNLRQTSASDQQKLRDKIVQSANSVRSMRSTVIQTVSQGERFEVSSESVANYNHCHALTIQYYEVLRHFKVRQRFADAREVLFVPLLMSQFDEQGKKASRWREPLQRALIDRRLITAFDAIDRVLHQWRDSGFPSGTYASENIIAANGVLNIRFVLQRPIDDIVEVDDTDRPPVFAGSQYSPPVWHKKKVGRIIKANWEKLKPFLEGVQPEQFYLDYLEGAADKDVVFHQMLGEKIARAFVNSLTFIVENESGNSSGTVSIDAAVTSRYVRNGMLKVTLRLTQPTSFARDKFHYLKIKTKFRLDLFPNLEITNLGDILPDGSYMTVESGFLRYRTKHFDGFLFKYQTLGDDLTATDGVTIYTGPTTDELRDPRKEDLAIMNRLIAHLNDNLEHYHAEIWREMDDKRRFMLLDGIILNGKGEGKSVASLVENNLLAIVGNSLVFPVAPGLNLNPDFGLKESLTEFYMTAAAEPISVSVPTKGVFAEAVMGKCNSCEKIDESRFWRWEESPIPDSPTAINPINTDTRRADPGDLQPQQLPNPIVNIQNAPNVPDPTGLAATLGLLGQSNVFKDITGLEGNQRNAIQAFQSSLEAAKAFGQGAANLEIQKTMERRLDKAMNAIDSDDSLSPEKKAELKEKALNAYLGGGPMKDEPINSARTNQFTADIKAIDSMQKEGVLTAEEAIKSKSKIAKNHTDSKEDNAISLVVRNSIDA
ncbi:MAG: hypothetical protein JNK77_04175 [Saprospiraceae bacterium]|nr:hypothetical protein [Saprospiraceae bacterium]